MSKTSLKIILVRISADLAATVQLFKDYVAWLDIDLAFQAFDAELASMPGKYAAPSGELLLARDTVGIAVGCVAIRPLSSGCCEVKRLWVAPAGRGLGVGRALVAAVIEAARRRGYGEMRLDTLPMMGAAIGLYESLGFERCEKYYETPIEGTVFLRKVLGEGVEDGKESD
ncbi:carbonic anhydrase [Mytilinidion resinicola]|uniref:Carbonic anhydrase n=1 Tax=Mytilinidion resinicola TaxID=574789 RepID=A0A6A6Z138_9PEZI|nr:carbonic anhydrase [Mytilinidion resinicola]KAF2814413.1 carbonic anhydrase [Mytilinidion resinicola]